MGRGMFQLCKNTSFAGADPENLERGVQSARKKLYTPIKQLGKQLGKSKPVKAECAIGNHAKKETREILTA